MPTPTNRSWAPVRALKVNAKVTIDDVTNILSVRAYVSRLGAKLGRKFSVCESGRAAAVVTRTA